MKATLSGNLILKGKLYKAGDVIDVSPALHKRLKEMGLIKKAKDKSPKAEGKRLIGSR